MAQRFTHIAVILTAIATTLALTAGAAAASSGLFDLIEVNSASDDLGSTAVETSGATYNASRNVLLTIDDEHNAYEFALAADGSIDQSITPRIIELDLGVDDFEGVAWIEGETYGFLSEGSGEVIVATIPDATNSGTTIRTRDIQRRFPVISGSWGNLGPEGLATDGDAFYVVREMPATVTKFDFSGNWVASVSISTHLADASGITVLNDGTYVIVSHESRLVAHYDIDWDLGIASQLGTRDAYSFSQLEGIASVNSTDLHLFGEDNTRKGQAGQTYSQLHGSLGGPSYDIGDVNCSGSTTVLDAMLVAQIRSGVAEADPSCGSGDMNGDGRLSILDAMLINNCSVGIPGLGCPAA